MPALGFAQQSLGVLMQRSEPLFALFDAGGGVEGVGIRTQPSLCICTVIITLSPYSQFYDPEGHVSCGYFRKCVFC
jgi:hypothetical protein